MTLSCGVLCHTDTIGTQITFAGVLPATTWHFRASTWENRSAQMPSSNRSLQIHLPVLQSRKHSAMPPTGTLSSWRSVPTYHDSSHSSPLRRPLLRSYCYRRSTFTEESRDHRSLLRRTPHIQHQRPRFFSCSFGLYLEKTRVGSHLPRRKGAPERR